MNKWMQDWRNPAKGPSGLACKVSAVVRNCTTLYGSADDDDDDDDQDDHEEKLLRA